MPQRQYRRRKRDSSVGEEEEQGGTENQEDTGEDVRCWQQLCVVLSINPLPDELFSVEVTFSLYMN